jgi:hypothetical protein
MMTITGPGEFKRFEHEDETKGWKWIVTVNNHGHIDIIPYTEQCWLELNINSVS